MLPVTTDGVQPVLPAQKIYRDQIALSMDESIESLLVLTDETGKALPCHIEATIVVDDVDYMLLQPVDHSVQIFAWEEGDEEEEEFLVDVSEEEEIDLIFAIAQAVLAEQNLTLKRTAFTLTVGGELPEVVEDEVFTIDTEEENGSEEFQELAQFFYEEQAYSVFTSLDPLMFFAKLGEDGKPQLLTPEELSVIQPYIEDQLIDIDEDS